MLLTMKNKVLVLVLRDIADGLGVHGGVFLDLEGHEVGTGKDLEDLRDG